MTLHVLPHSFPQQLFSDRAVFGDGQDMLGRRVAGAGRGNRARRVRRALDGAGLAGRADHAGQVRDLGAELYVVAIEVEDERSEEHTSELQSLMRNSYAVFSLTKTNQVMLLYT